MTDCIPVTVAVVVVMALGPVVVAMRAALVRYGRGLAGRQVDAESLWARIAPKDEQDVR